MGEFNPEFGKGKYLAGQQYDPRKNILHKFVQWMFPYTGPDTARITSLEGTAALEQTPQDASQAQERQYDISAIQASILALSYSWFSYASIPLPDTLTGITIVYSANQGDGTSSNPASQMTAAFINGGTVSLQPRSHSQASAAIIPDILPTTVAPWTQELPAMNYVFYTLGSNTLEIILARVTQIIGLATTTVTISHASPGVVSGLTLANDLTVLLGVIGGTLPAPLVTTRVYYVVNASGSTFQVSLTKGGAAINTTTAGTGTFSAVQSVQPFPLFKVAYYTVSATGQQISVSADANATATLNASFDGNSLAGSSQYGTGTSQESGINVKTIRIGPVINAAITPVIVGTTTASITATATATTPALVLNGTTQVAAISSNTATKTATASAVVSFSSLAATSVPAIPTSGLYLVPRTDSELDEYGMIQNHAAVIDFSIFA